MEMGESQLRCLLIALTSRLFYLRLLGVRTCVQSRARASTLELELKLEQIVLL